MILQQRQWTTVIQQEFVCIVIKFKNISSIVRADKSALCDIEWRLAFDAFLQYTKDKGLISIRG